LSGGFCWAGVGVSRPAARAGPGFAAGQTSREHGGLHRISGSPADAQARMNSPSLARRAGVSGAIVIRFRLPSAQILVGLAPPNEAVRTTSTSTSAARDGCCSAAHGHAVGAGAESGHEIAAPQRRQTDDSSPENRPTRTPDRRRPAARCGHVALVVLRRRRQTGGRLDGPDAMERIEASGGSGRSWGVLDQETLAAGLLV